MDAPLTPDLRSTLEAQYPDIALIISAIWDSHEVLCPFLDSLLLGNWDDQEKITPEIEQELFMLYEMRCLIDQDLLGFTHLERDLQHIK